MIPGVIVAGLFAGFSSLIVQLNPDYSKSKLLYVIYNFLALGSSSFMAYITAWAGYRAAERFGATPILGGILGMVTSLPCIDAIAKTLGLFNDASPLQSIFRTGKGGVLAVIFGVYVLSLIEKKIKKIVPASITIVFTPLITVILSIVPYILIVMPVFGFVSTGIVWISSKICMSEYFIVRIITGYISAAVFLPLVASGMHHGLVALYSVQLQKLGYVTLYPTLAMAGAGQVYNELLSDGFDAKIPPVGIMIETPAAALCSLELAELADFFSIGSNDLTQYTLALDREAQGLERYFNPYNEAVYKLIEMAACNGHKNGIETGILENLLNC